MRKTANPRLELDQHSLEQAVIGALEGGGPAFDALTEISRQHPQHESHFIARWLLNTTPPEELPEHVRAFVLNVARGTTAKHAHATNFDRRIPELVKRKLLRLSGERMEMTDDDERLERFVRIGRWPDSLVAPRDHVIVKGNRSSSNAPPAWTYAWLMDEKTVRALCTPGADIPRPRKKNTEGIWWSLSYSVLPRVGRKLLPEGADVSTFLINYKEWLGHTLHDGSEYLVPDWATFTEEQLRQLDRADYNSASYELGRRGLLSEYNDKHWINGVIQKELDLLPKPIGCRVTKYDFEHLTVFNSPVAAAARIQQWHEAGVRIIPNDEPFARGDEITFEMTIGLKVTKEDALRYLKMHTKVPTPA